MGDYLPLEQLQYNHAIEPGQALKTPQAYLDLAGRVYPFPTVQTIPVIMVGWSHP